MIRVLVAEDHTIVREGIKQLIGLAKDMQVAGEAGNGEQLLEKVEMTLKVVSRITSSGFCALSQNSR